MVKPYSFTKCDDFSALLHVIIKICVENNDSCVAYALEMPVFHISMHTIYHRYIQHNAMKAVNYSRA